MPPDRVLSSLERKHLENNPVWTSSVQHGESMIDSPVSADIGVESEADDLPQFKSDITQLCEQCSKIDLAFILQHAREFMKGGTAYELGTFQ